MDEVAEFVCKTPGSAYFALDKLSSDLIDYIFTIANPHYFYLLAVLRLVCKRLREKIPLTIYTHLADVGASFCGDLSVLRWIYNTVGIANVEGCITSAGVAGHVHVVTYLKSYLHLKESESATNAYAAQAPKGWKARSMPKSRIGLYVVYLLLGIFSEGPENVDGARTKFNKVMSDYAPFLDRENLAEIARRLSCPSGGVAALTANRSIHPSVKVVHWFWCACGKFVQPDLWDQATAEHNTGSPRIFEFAVSPGTDPALGYRLIKQSGFVAHIKATLGIKDPAQAILDVRDLRGFAANRGGCRDTFVRIIELTERNGVNPYSGLGPTFYRIYIKAMWELPCVGQWTAIPIEVANTLGDINDHRIVHVLEKHRDSFGEDGLLAYMMLAHAIEAENFHIIKYLADTSQPAPLVRDIVRFWEFVQPHTTAEAVEVLFSATNQSGVLLGHKYVLEDNAALFDVLKTHGRSAKELDLRPDSVLPQLPAVFLAGYHDREGQTDEYLYDPRDQTEWAFVYAFTAIPIVPHTPSPFGRLPVARGPRSSLSRKKALLSFDPVFLHILLVTADSRFDELFERRKRG